MSAGFSVAIPNSTSGWVLGGVVVLLVMLVAWIGSPRRGFDRRQVTATVASALLLLCLAASRQAWALCLLGPLSLLPLRMLLGARHSQRARTALTVVIVGTALPLAVAVAAWWVGMGSSALTVAAVVVAVAVRMGVFPFHLWLPILAEEAPLPASLLVATTPVIPLVAARVLPALALSTYPHLQSFFIVMGAVGGLYGAILALSQVRLRRLLGFLAVSQAGCLFAGLCLGSTESATGALLAAIAYGLPMCGLMMLAAAIEARTGTTLLNRMHGLVGPAPHLAAAFLLLGFANVGFPGSLGFVAEDILLHGIIAAHPVIAAVLVLITALNAVTTFRTFQRVFLGPLLRHDQLAAMADLLVRERIIVVVLAVLVVANGVAPGPLVQRVHEIAVASGAALEGDPR